VASHQLYLAHSRALELQLFSFALTVSRTLSCARASARAVPSAASLQLYLAHYRALELQHARCPLRLRIKCISRTPVHSSFSTRGALCGFALGSRALCGFASSVSRTTVHSSFSTRGARCGFASAVSRALSCTRASALQLRFNCVSHTLVRSSFSTRGAHCSFASAVSRALPCTRASARAVPSAASLQLYLAHYRALELQHARCPLRLRIKISRTLVHSSFSTHQLYLAHSRALELQLRISCISRTVVHSSFSTRGARCGFASAVSRALSCTRASARVGPSAASL
jgi:hypothetical protein